MRAPGWQKPVRGAMLNRSHPFGDMIFCLVMNELSGNRIYSLGRHKLTGVFTNDVNWQDSTVGRVLDFGGTTDYINFGTTAMLPVTEPWTLAWKAYTDTHANYDGIMSFVVGSDPFSMAYATNSSGLCRLRAIV